MLWYRRLNRRLFACRVRAKEDAERSWIVAWPDGFIQLCLENSMSLINKGRFVFSELVGGNGKWAEKNGRTGSNGRLRETSARALNGCACAEQVRNHQL